jgi:hypothetical protein
VTASRSQESRRNRPGPGRDLSPGRSVARRAAAAAASDLNCSASLRLVTVTSPGAAAPARAELRRTRTPSQSQADSDTCRSALLPAQLLSAAAGAGPTRARELSVSQPVVPLSGQSLKVSRQARARATLSAAGGSPAGRPILTQVFNTTCSCHGQSTSDSLLKLHRANHDGPSPASRCPAPTNLCPDTGLQTWEGNCSGVLSRL